MEGLFPHCVFPLWHSVESTTSTNETRWIYFRQLLDGLQVLQLCVCVCVRVLLPTALLLLNVRAPLPCVWQRVYIKRGGGVHSGPLCVWLHCVYHEISADSFMRRPRHKSEPNPAVVYYSLIDQSSAVSPRLPARTGLCFWPKDETPAEDGGGGQSWFFE